MHLNIEKEIISEKDGFKNLNNPHPPKCLTNISP